MKFNNNLIIIEGCDKTGKSTLALEYINEGYECFHFGEPRPEEDTYRTYMTFLNSLDPEKKYVLDRFHLGEIVYGKIYRNGEGLTKEQFRNINLKIAKFNHMLVLCEQPIDIIEKKFEENEEDYAQIEDIRKILKFFSLAWDQTPLNKVVYNYNNAGLTFPPIYCQPEFVHLESVGRFEAEYMFIGDKGNIKGKYADLHQAFDFGVSSKYLFSLIKKLEINLDNIYITNAYKTTGDNRKTLSKEVEIIQPKYIIVMGQKAKLITDNIYAPHSKKIHIPHPAYLNRFPTSFTNFDINKLKYDLRR